MSREHILVVDDESGVRLSLKGVLEDEGYGVETSVSAEEALSLLERNRYDLVILDIWLPAMDGVEALVTIRHRKLDVAVVMISGHGTIETAVKAIKCGAYDFVEKPLSLDKTVIVVKNALQHRRLELENRYLRDRFESKQVLIGDSLPMHELRNEITLAAPTNGRVLIQCRPADTQRHVLPDPPDVKIILCHIWNIQNTLAEERHMPDRLGNIISISKGNGRPVPDPAA